MTGVVKAFGGLNAGAYQRRNADLVTDAVRLGYVQMSGAPVLDCTYGLGRFWTHGAPAGLIATDLDPARVAAAEARGIPAQVASFTELPFPPGMFSATVLDPPYKLNGTSSGVGAASCDADYGVAGAVWSKLPWQDRHAVIIAGIGEAVRVTADGGHVLVKCQAQVCSGAVRWQTREFADALEAAGAAVVDELHLGSYRAQPPGRTQRRARRNYSTLLVARRGARASTSPAGLVAAAQRLLAVGAEQGVDVDALLAGLRSGDPA